MKIEEFRSTLQPLQEFSDKPPEIYEIVLSTIPKKIDKSDLRKICEGMHIISTELHTDNLTGESKGTGTIKLRCANEKKLRNFEYKLLKEGIESRPRAKSSKVKNSWYYSNEQQKENNPRIVKVQEQQSHVFGRPRKFTPVRQQRDTAFQSLMQWKKTQNARREKF